MARVHIIVVGLNYRTTPVAIRERFAIAERALPEAILQLKQTKSILECVIVATCNRTEIYAVVDHNHQCGHYVRSFLASLAGLQREQFAQYLYMHEGDGAVRHLMHVASGLDSMVIGETQILGQVRDAFLLAQRLGATGTLFNMMFKQAITLAKRAHSETSIGEAAVSVSYAAVELGKRIFGRFNGKTVMILGAGKMSELTARHLHANGAERLYVVNRTYERALELSGRFNGIPLTMDEAADRLHEADVVISSTGASEYVLRKEQVEAGMKRRKSKPLFMIDIAVPRDLDPNIADIDNVFLYDIDDLEGIVESNLELRRREAVKIDAMIEEEIAQFSEWYKTLGVVPLIRALQDKAAAIHADTMESLTNKLPDLTERELKVIRKLTKSIVNQMMHDPILRIKEMAGERRADEAMDMFVKLFALEEPLAKAAMAERETADAGQPQRAAASESKDDGLKGAAGFGLAAVTP